MRAALLWLTLGFVGNGFAQFFQKHLHASGLGGYQSSALILMNATAALFMLLLVLTFKGRVTRRELLFGLCVGLCSYLGSFAVLRALGFMPAYVVFPLIVGGPIVMVALYSAIFGGERLSRTALCGVLCGIISILLLTVG